MRVIIAGSRSFEDLDLLCNFCDYVLSDLDDIEIVSGTAEGADNLGEEYAKLRGYPIKPFPANWKRYGKAAGPIRNEEMAAYSNMLIVFWDGKRKKKKNMIDTAEKKGLLVRVCMFTPKPITPKIYKGQWFQSIKEQ